MTLKGERADHTDTWGMVDPHNVTNYRRSMSELQEWLLFSIAVAGKTAVIISGALDRFLWLARSQTGKYHRQKGRSINTLKVAPFALIRSLIGSEAVSGENTLLALIKKSGLGKHRVLEKAMRQIAAGNLDLRKCTLDDLMKIHGVGPKTARMFLLHSREGVELAVPDTHILAELTERGYDVPSSSPNSPKVLSKIDHFVKIESVRDGMSMVEWDLHIWKKRTKTKPITDKVAVAKD